MPDAINLINLARVVEEAPDHLFDMARIKFHSQAGTKRCAIGWARIDPWFREETKLLGTFRRIGPLVYTDCDLLAELFGIGVPDCRRLIGDGRVYGTPRGRKGKQEVLENIGRLLAGDRAEIYGSGR